MNEIRLPNGRTAVLKSGRVEVLPDDGKVYKLTVVHTTGGEMTATCRDYQKLLAFLRQVENLHYELRSLSLDT